MSATRPDDAVYAGGFADPVFASQAVFRAILAAMAEPARPVDCAPRAVAPAPMTPLAASVALALADQDTPVWLDPVLAAEPAVARWLAFHAGAPVTRDPAEAAFAFVSALDRLPALATFAPGTADYPDRSTTVVVAVDGFSDEGPLFSGPGFEAPRRFSPLPGHPRLAGDVAANRALFPRGVDILFTAADRLAALPRSVRILPE
jgi:alpha-D-ribose 1-methylphosphonate 5-triphosphate synthase subunit PhnH